MKINVHKNVWLLKDIAPKNLFFNFSRLISLSSSTFAHLLSAGSHIDSIFKQLYGCSKELIISKYIDYHLWNILLIQLRIKIHIQYFQDIPYNSRTIFTFTLCIFHNHLYSLFLMLAIIKCLCVIIFCGRRIFITHNWRRV